MDRPHSFNVYTWLNTPTVGRHLLLREIHSLRLAAAAAAMEEEEEEAVARLPYLEDQAL